MTAAEVVSRVKGEFGLELNESRLRRAAKNGRVPRRQEKGGWLPEDIPAVAAYFQNPIGRGRPKRVRE